MRRLPRSQWLDWCDQLSRGRSDHLEVTEPGLEHGVVRTIDYAPFDDILALDIEDHGKICRHLIDHPAGIWIEDSEPEDTVVIESPEDRFHLALVHTPLPCGRNESVAWAPSREWSDIPEPLRGAYFEG